MTVHSHLPCDFCDQNTLTHLYRAVDTTRNITVSVCDTCGLVQSTPRIDHVKDRPMAVSSGANWGNVRYGKAFRTQDNLKIIEKHVPLSEGLRILDVGANRGSFCKEILSRFPDCEFVAVEPDERVDGDYKGHPEITLHSDRIENVALEIESFDFIYSCHTLEHLKSPQRTMADHWRTLKMGGYLFLDLPNVDLVGTQDILEEWFIDKHLYHYSADVLIDQVKALGFEVIEGPDPEDLVNIVLLLRKVETKTQVQPHPERALRAKQLINTYVSHRQRNRKALVKVARRIEGLSDRKVAIWGAGRLFNSLVDDGGLNTDCICALVDKHLVNFTDAQNGVSLITPQALADVQPDIIVVMSRSFFSEICDEAIDLVPNAEILGYHDLLTEALKTKAA